VGETPNGHHHADNEPEEDADGDGVADVVCSGRERDPGSKREQWNGNAR
jgi:hypothetical protein